jgi:hypothetical protein
MRELEGFQLRHIAYFRVQKGASERYCKKRAGPGSSQTLPAHLHALVGGNAELRIKAITHCRGVGRYHPRYWG